MLHRLSLPAIFLSSLLCVAAVSNAGAQDSPHPSRLQPAVEGLPAASQSSGSAVSDSGEEMVAVPGPLRSFLRMASLSQLVSPEDVLPLLARKVTTSGYSDGKPTEYLILVNWYLDQARELEALAGKQGVLHVSNCEDAQPLLAILGYRLRKTCGPDAAVETANANRAFLTIDSGFPLEDLEETLRGGKSFDLPYSPTNLPVLFQSRDWLLNKKSEKLGLVASLLREPRLARLYWGISRMDTETAQYLWRSLGPKKLISGAPVLDFYGSHISVRSGRVIVPGGTRAELAWKELAGAAPSQPAEFVNKLVNKDDGWMAAYFDALSRAAPEQQDFFVEPHRLRGFYEALRGTDIAPAPARHSFRPDQGLFLLVTRLQLEADGKPHIPGNVEVWKDLLQGKNDSKLIREWGKRARGWNDPEQVLEGMFGVSRLQETDGPMHCFLALTEIDRNRSGHHPLSPQAARLLAEKYERFGDQYPIFAEFHALNDTSITLFLTVAEDLDRIPDLLARTDALGTLQAEVGLWQILARQREIPESKLNDTWQKIVKPFAAVHTSPEIFTAGKTALGELLLAAAGKATLPQDQILALLAGPEQTSRDGQQVRSEMAGRMRQVMEDQRLVSLDTLLALGEGLNELAQGKDAAPWMLTLAGELHEFEMPKPLFTNSERMELAQGVYGNRHTLLQMKTDFAKVIKSHGDPAELTRARGLLTPFFRDTLVGLNYAYYEPPGAQMLHHNPLFVRTHDFSGGEYSGEIADAPEQVWRSPRLFGRGWTASGGAHLIGSLADLPYVLATVEEDFIVPKNVQSLIWEDMTPGLVTSAVLPRWWGVTPNELHAAALYQRTGEELLASAARDEKVRQEVLNILSDRVLPRRLERMNSALCSSQPDTALDLAAPAETFYLAFEFRRRFPEDKKDWGASGKELDDLVARFPQETSWRRLSEDFGVPHPALALSYGRELINLKPIPTFLDYSSRLLAESWDSSNLYWARLADEMGYSPVMLNELVPQLTRRMVEQTFASQLEDWPAVLRAMRETGEEFRQGKIALLPKDSPSSGL
ncbi:MAG: hypothetical protein ACRD4Y_05965 [Candidatus Acidiferrales bacterium]